MDQYKNVKGYVCHAECNSPRAEFIREFDSWFLEDDLDRIMSVLDENIVWEMVGLLPPVEGIDAVRKFQTQPPPGEGDMRLVEEQVDGILVDGLWGCSFGTSKMSNGDVYAFNDVIRFKEGDEIKIEKLKSYVIKLNQ